MSCPYFMPAARLENAAWPHPRRLPLGAGWSGCCTAPGHDGAIPLEGELRDGCNLGYARQCARLPQERAGDAVRFSIARDREQRIALRYALERAHLPGENGLLEYDVSAGDWTAAHPDTRIQQQAACYLEAYLERRLSQA